MMMATISTGFRSAGLTVKKWSTDPRVHAAVRVGLHLLAGFSLAAASLSHHALPLAAGAVCGLGGWQAALVALGSAAGYMTYWGQEGIMGVVWVAAALAAALAVGDRQITKATPLLLPAIAGLIAAGSGLGFQILLEDATPIGIYFLRIALAAATTRLTAVVTSRRDPIPDWLACGFWVLALVQTVPVTAINPGLLAAGFLAAGRAFPPAAIAGLALDLAQVSPVPMTAALSMAWLAELVPRGNVWTKRMAPAGGYLLVMALCGLWQPVAAVPLAVGGLLRGLAPGERARIYRRGETGAAQVRLEMAAGVLAQTQQVLLETRQTGVDEEALMEKCAQAACGSCSCRKSCQEKEDVLALTGRALHRDYLSKEDLPVSCRRPERLLQELRRSQEQLRLLRGSHARERECMAAVAQQYSFLGQYLQELSDALAKRQKVGRVRFQPKVAVYANRRESENGDRCCWFAGTENRYYVVLCDGMGTGLGAVAEGSEAMSMLKRLLCAGFPAEYALRSLNSLCALRGCAGAVSVDIAQINLENGKATLYKWGAAPSWRLSSLGAEKIGTATPPPGLRIAEGREAVEQLSLRRGETLVLLSDGVGGEDALQSMAVPGSMPLGEVAAEILELSNLSGGDDATIAAIRLTPAS